MPGQMFHGVRMTGQEHSEHLVAKELLDGLDLLEVRNPEHVRAVESSVGEQATESLHRDDRSGLEPCSRQDLLTGSLSWSGQPGMLMVRRRAFPVAPGMANPLPGG